MWVLFRVPCPTPDGRTAQDLYQSRVTGISPEMQLSAKQHGCLFHRAWFAQDGSEFVALAKWETREGASAFYEEWSIENEPGDSPERQLGTVNVLSACGEVDSQPVVYFGIEVLQPKANRVDFSMTLGTLRFVLVCQLKLAGRKHLAL